MRKDTIEHDGVIDSIEGGRIRVKIIQQAACSGCKAKSMCTQSESKEKFIDVYVDDAGSRHVGDAVKVCGELSMGRRAVVLAFGIPLVLMVSWMFAAIVGLKMNELLAVGVLALILTLYFFILHLLKPIISRKFAFWLAN